MIQRRTTLEEALAEIEAGALIGVSAIVVNREWWQHLSRAAQDSYQQRCAQLSLDLRADSVISRHFVELASGRREPPLSTEERV